MKKVILFLIGLVIIFIQTFVINYFSRFVSLNLLLVYTVLISLYTDKNEALVLSGILGLFQGIVSSGIVGLEAILLLAVSYFISVVERYIFKDNKNIICLLVLVISLVYSIIYGIISALVFSPSPIVIAIIKVILITLLNTVVTYTAYGIFEDSLKKLREE